MSNNIENIPGSIGPDEAMEIIEVLTKEAADSVSGFMTGAGMEEYKNFLDTMYHYTRHTGEKAIEASENVASDELKAFFKHFEEEEAWHYKLALRDLQAFGLEPSAQQPQSVADFDNFWASLKDKDENTYLGALYIFENIVKYVGPDVKAFIERLDLENKQCCWMREHAEADLEHGEEVAEMLQKYLANNPAAAVDGAREASQVWIGVMKTAFTLPKAA